MCTHKCTCPVYAITVCAPAIDANMQKPRPIPHLQIFSFLHFCVTCALNYVILQYEACIINSFRVTVLGSSRCVILHLYANLK